ncbi:MAG: hypothetical protein HWE23_05035 [Rhodobacteraceae bacterium]|nr:hypothetical protein [Paracoccaceae bacterium]
MFDVGALSFVTFLWANKEKLIMHIDSIKHLKTRDVFILSFYCSIGLSLIGFLLILFAQILGVPMVFNGVKYSGLLGVLYSFLIIPIWIICFTVAFGFYLSLGWKLARVILPVFGFWPKNDA